MEMKIYKKTYGVRKNKFFENYDPDEKIDVKKTAESFGVSIQCVYKWIKQFNADKK